MQEHVNLWRMTDDVPNLKDAYALSSRAGIKRLYADWAQSYDSGFCEAEGYQLHRHIAQTFVTAGGTGPVLDFGAGTGVVGEALAQFGVEVIDAADLSADMLAVARDKMVYRDLHCVDVLSDGHGLVGGYNGVVSAGTFTLGHVGPEGVAPLIALAAPGAVFALSINAVHFDQAGFAATFDGLADRITDFSLTKVRIYDDRAQASHRDDLAFVARFVVR